MTKSKLTSEELESKIFHLQKELFELKSKLKQIEHNTSTEGHSSELSIMDQVMNISPIGISYVDASGKVVYSNKMAEEIFRLPKKKLMEIEANSAAWQATTLDGEPFPDKELPFVRVKNTKKAVLNVEHGIEYKGEKKNNFCKCSPIAR